MSKHEFDPKCPDCRPILMNQRTGKVLPKDDPYMKTVDAVWDASSREEQEAFHRVTVKGSRDPGDLTLLKALSERIENAGKN